MTTLSNRNIYLEAQKHSNVRCGLIYVVTREGKSGAWTHRSCLVRLTMEHTLSSPSIFGRPYSSSLTCCLGQTHKSITLTGHNRSNANDIQNVILLNWLTKGILKHCRNTWVNVSYVLSCCTFYKFCKVPHTNNKWQTQAHVNATNINVMQTILLLYNRPFVVHCELLAGQSRGLHTMILLRFGLSFTRRWRSHSKTFKSDWGPVLVLLHRFGWLRVNVDCVDKVFISMQIGNGMKVVFSWPALSCKRPESTARPPSSLQCVHLNIHITFYKMSC